MLVVGLVALLTRDGDREVDVTHLPPPREDGTAVLGAAALRELTEAVGSGTSPHGALAEQIAANARALRVTDFSLRYIAEDDAAAVGKNRWVAEVDATWAFEGFDAAPAATPVSVTFARTGDHADVVAIGGHGRRSPLWLSGPVEVRRSPQALVLAAAPRQGPAPDVDRYAGLARQAVQVVRRMEPGWRSGLVVEVPATAAGVDTSLAAKPGDYAQIAAVTASVDGSQALDAPVHVFVNPETFAPLGDRGAQVVMSHEATHVATDAARASMPLWLLEGYADYVALRDVAISEADAAAQAAARVREDGVPKALPADAEFGTRTTHLGAVYEEAWLACVSVADLAGEDALRRVYRAVRDGEDLETALAGVDLSVADVTRAWQQRLESLAAGGSESGEVPAA